MEHGFILGGHVTGANVSDSIELWQVLEKCKLPGGAEVQGDKGYAGESTRWVVERAFG